MFAYTQPCGVRPLGNDDPKCVPNEGHWTRHWTVGDAIDNFETVPQLPHLLERESTLAGIWQILTLGIQSQLEEQFVMYDLAAGRA